MPNCDFNIITNPNCDFNSIILFTDFTTGLINKQITPEKVEDLMKGLHNFSGFSFIVPRKYVKHIKCKYYIQREVNKKDGEQYDDDLMINSFGVGK